MQWQEIPVLLLLIAAAVSAALAFLAYRRGRSPRARPLVFLALAAATWQFGYAFELGNADQATKPLWAKPLRMLELLDMVEALLAREGSGYTPSDLGGRGSGSRTSRGRNGTRSGNPYLT